MSDMRMFTLQEMREADKERGMQRVRQKVIGMHMQVKNGFLYRLLNVRAGLKPALTNF